MGEWSAGGGMWTGTRGATTFIMAAYFVNARCKCDPPSRKHFRGLRGTSRECTGISLFLVLLIVCCVAYKSRKWFLHRLPHVFCRLCSAFVGAASACWGDCDLRRFCEMSDDPASAPLSSSFHHVRSMTPISKRRRSLLELCPFVFHFFFEVEEVEEDHMRWSSSCATHSTSVTRR